MGLGETEDQHQDERENIHWTKIKEVATPSEYRRACGSNQWIKEMEALTEDAGKRQGSNAPKIRNAGLRVDTFITIKEGDPSSGEPRGSPPVAI